MRRSACCFLINSNCCFCCCCCCLTNANLTLCSIANFFAFFIDSSNSLDLNFVTSLFASVLAPKSLKMKDFCSSSFKGECDLCGRTSFEDIRGISILKSDFSLDKFNSFEVIFVLLFPFLIKYAFDSSLKSELNILYELDKLSKLLFYFKNK